MTDINRIRYWRLLRGMSLQQLADASLTSKSQIDKLERGDRRLTVDWMVRLAKPLDCDPRDLLPMETMSFPRKRESSASDSEHIRHKQLSIKPDPDFLTHLARRRGPLDSRFRGNDTVGTPLPVRGAARGGKDQEMFLTDGPIDQVPRPHYLTHVKDAYAIYVVGSSMVPMYRPRQLLFVHPYKPPSPGSGVVITKNNGAVLIKEFVKHKQTGIVVREYHPEIRLFTVPQGDIATVHAVVGATEPQ